MDENESLTLLSFVVLARVLYTNIWSSTAHEIASKVSKTSRTRERCENILSNELKTEQLNFVPFKWKSVAVVVLVFFFQCSHLKNALSKSREAAE